MNKLKRGFIKCPYCDELYPISMMKTDSINVCLQKNTIKVTVNIPDKRESVSWIPMNYCPVCGKEMKNDR